MTAADPRRLAEFDTRDEAERHAREIAVHEVARRYGVDRPEAERMLAEALAFPKPKRSIRCRLGLHRFDDTGAIAQAGAGVVISHRHGPITTPGFTVIGQTCRRCPTVRFGVITEAS